MITQTRKGIRNYHLKAQKMTQGYQRPSKICNSSIEMIIIQDFLVINQIFCKLSKLILGNFYKIMIENSKITLINLTKIIKVYNKIKNNKKTYNYYILNKILNVFNKIR